VQCKGAIAECPLNTPLARSYTPMPATYLHTHSGG